MSRLLYFFTLVLAPIAFLGILGTRFLVFAPFSIPSESMLPTLLAGDYVLVNMTSYGYSRYSLPLAPDFPGRIWDAELGRGDLVTFALPRDPGTKFIKRVIGLPGDEIVVGDGAPVINGQPVTQERLGEGEASANATSAQYQRYRETLPNGASYEVVYGTPASPARGAWRVPAGHFFVMGDSRDNSTDSRFEEVGFIPYDHLIGRVALIFFSQEPGEGTVRSERLFRIPR